MALQPTLAERFERDRTDTVHHQGKIVRAVAHLPVSDGSRITVRFVHASTTRPQGLELGLDDGELEVNGCRAPLIVLWAGSCPPEVDLIVHGTGSTTLDVWNCWSLGGVDTAWIGNAGMVSRTGTRADATTAMTLRCSDGVGPADFDDLEVELIVR